MVRIVLILLLCRSAFALDWIWLTPNPSYSRDLSMGSSTIALPYPVQGESANPAGLSTFPANSRRIGLLVLNPAVAVQVSNYLDDESSGKRDAERLAEAARLLVNAAAYRSRYVTLALLLSRPVLSSGSIVPYHDYERTSSLESNMNSVIGTINLHRRVALGGRIDRYYRYSDPMGEGYSYGVILRPRGVAFGVQYQRFPGTGNRLWHPFDRRDDGTTAAGVAWNRGGVTLCGQIMNLTQSDRDAYLEPHAGFEWRPARAFALRGGGMQFTRSHRWAWTAGLSLLDGNWFRARAARLTVPDDILQLAVAVQYRDRALEFGLASLTCALRW